MKSAGGGGGGGGGGGEEEDVEPGCCCCCCCLVRTLAEVLFLLLWLRLLVLPSDIASNRMSRTLKINIILRIDLFFRITFQRGRSKVGRTKPRGRKSPSPLHHHDTDIDTR